MICHFWQEKSLQKINCKKFKCTHVNTKSLGENCSLAASPWLTVSFSQTIYYLLNSSTDFSFLGQVLLPVLVHWHNRWKLSIKCSSLQLSTQHSSMPGPWYYRDDSDRDLQVRQQTVITLLQLSSALSLCPNSVYRWDQATELRVYCPLWDNITGIVEVPNYTMCMCERFTFDSQQITTTTHCFLLQIQQWRTMCLWV